LAGPQKSPLFLAPQKSQEIVQKLVSKKTLYSHGATGLIYNAKYPHRIGADCRLGMGCIVQPQVTIGDRVIVMPGLVIRSDVASPTP
jgi:acetyltransferase-like isoleucine patch superfamily enzyme